MIITYRITCHEADGYFKLCRSDGKKPTIAGLVDYVKANRA